MIIELDRQRAHAIKHIARQTNSTSHRPNTSPKQNTALVTWLDPTDKNNPKIPAMNPTRIEIQAPGHLSLPCTPCLTKVAMTPSDTPSRKAISTLMLR